MLTNENAPIITGIKLVYPELSQNEQFAQKNERFTHALIFGERPERFTHNRSFPLSDLSESLMVAHFW